MQSTSHVKQPSIYNHNSKYTYILHYLLPPLINHNFHYKKVVTFARSCSSGHCPSRRPHQNPQLFHQTAPHISERTMSPKTSTLCISLLVLHKLSILMLAQKPMPISSGHQNKSQVWVSCDAIN
jgi:hypothetical protein